MDRTADGGAPEWRSALVDVSDMSLEELAADPAVEGSALAGALRRLATDLEEPGEPIAGFNSAL